MVELNTTINMSVVLKIYNQSNIEQIRCSVGIKHSDKCRFFLVLGNGPVLLRMSNIELVFIIRVKCEAIDNKTNDRKFDAQTRHAADSQNCSTNRDPLTKPDAYNMRGDKTNTPNYLNSSTKQNQMSDYFHSSDNKEADKIVSETITHRIPNEFNNSFSGIGCFEGTFALQVKEGSHPYQAPQRRVAYTLQKPLKEKSWNGYRSSKLLIC